MENEHFSSSSEEGWIHPLFCQEVLTSSGDGVVKEYTITTSPASWRVLFLIEEEKLSELLITHRRKIYS